MSDYSRFFARPDEGELLTARVTLTGQPGCAILGTACTPEGRPAQGALALLFSIAEDGSPALLGQFVTDEEGQFFFGPLQSGRLYLVKLAAGGSGVRVLEQP